MNRSLLNSALALYVDKTQRELENSKSWIREPSNFISVVAFLISVASAIYGVTKDWRDSIDKDLQSLSAIVAQLTQLDAEVFRTIAAASPGGSTGMSQQALQAYERSMNNRRLVLLADVDRLTDGLGDRAPRAQLAVLGTAFAQLSDYDRARKYFALMTSAPASPTLQLTAWKSLALVDVYRGPQFYDLARSEFGNALKAVPNPEDVVSIQLVIDVQQNWAQFEFGAQNQAAGVEHLINARLLSAKLPCDSGVRASVQQISGLVEAGLTSMANKDAAAAAAMREQFSTAVHQDHCLS
jgi:tetratricopeptide (TPR) repeat protein